MLAESRRSDYDVTDTVLVSSAADVRAAVEELFARVWPGRKFPAFAHVFNDFERMFSGRMPGYFGVDTVYHDQQHTLDITLATARLIAGHELQVPEPQRFGPERAMLGIVATRISISERPTFCLAAPSCGRRRSAMLRPARILIREIRACGEALAGAATARSKPSTRIRTTRPFRNGSM